MRKKVLSLAIIFLTFPLLTQAQAWNPNGLGYATGLPQGSISGIIMNIMFWLLAMLGIFGVIGFTIAGIMYLVSTGDEGMIDKAKEAMKWSIVGILVGLLGVVVIQAIDLMLNQFSNF
ncbi:MAG: hypothetical protein WC238_02905 [Parcubacteria group bacterium]|jgi:hypothetical protein